MTMKTKFNQLKLGVKKNSPAIFTGVGIAGLGVTAYLAYKSRPKVEKIVNNIEEKRVNEEKVNPMEVTRDLVGALYLPITTGLASVGCFVMSYKIQNNRILTLAGALTVARENAEYFDSRFKEKYGDEEYEKFMSPTEEIERKVVDKNGKETTRLEEIKADADKAYGEWFDTSTEYTSDDHTYNMQYIDARLEHAELILFQNGFLLLNELRDILGFERTRQGALLGWSTADHFDIEKIVVNAFNPLTEQLQPEIFIKWSTPTYIYDAVEFK